MKKILFLFVIALCLISCTNTEYDKKVEQCIADIEEWEGGDLYLAQYQVNNWDEIGMKSSTVVIGTAYDGGISMSEARIIRSTMVNTVKDAYNKCMLEYKEIADPPFYRLNRADQIHAIKESMDKLNKIVDNPWGYHNDPYLFMSKYKQAAAELDSVINAYKGEYMVEKK